MAVDWSVCIIAAIIILLLYFVCIRRRRRAPVKAAVVTSERVNKTSSGIVKETITTTTTTKTFSSYSAKQNDFKRPANRVIEMFQSHDLKTVADRFSTLDEVSAAIRKAGLEKCNLIFGVDYTASNAQQGRKTFGGKSLHSISDTELNPYQKVITVLGETLEPFDSEGVIPAFGFGDMYTRDRSIFSLTQDGVCHNFKDVLRVYNERTPRVILSGPTNFAPLIRQSIDIVKSTQSYHILVIVADGQVNKDEDTTDAIVEASHLPLSIIMVGVGDGPWDVVDEFDQKIPARSFDNFHFVDYQLVTENVKNPSASFALHALMEIPDQFQAIKRLGLLK